MAGYVSSYLLQPSGNSGLQVLYRYMHSLPLPVEQLLAPEVFLSWHSSNTCCPFITILPILFYRAGYPHVVDKNVRAIIAPS